METLWNGVRMHTRSGFPLGTDAVLLADFVAAALGKNARVADLGSGTGALGLLLCASRTDCSVTGVELDEAAHTVALANIAENGLAARLCALHGDVRQIVSLLPASSFNWVVSNPPYFPAGSGRVSGKYPMARSEAFLPLEALCAAAAHLLPTGGRFALVHRPERLCDLFCALRGAGLEPKRLRFVRHRPDSPVCLVLLEARRGGKPGLRLDPELIEFTSDGEASAAYRAAYHTGAKL